MCCPVRLLIDQLTPRGADRKNSRRKPRNLQLCDLTWRQLPSTHCKVQCRICCLDGGKPNATHDVINN
ncbi:hypothetical protein VTK26DRAFT_4428 [Humicola hyalothermophila]